MQTNWVSDDKCIRSSTVKLLRRSGTNNSAMFAEIVPEQLRSAVYAFDRSFEGAVGATAAPLVGERIKYLLSACTI